MALPLFADSRRVHGESIGGSWFFGITIPALLREVYRGGHDRETG